jgi:hypothetical protein
MFSPTRNVSLVTSPVRRRAKPSVAPGSLVTWYLGLVPHWMGVTSRVERRLLLRTHQWIVERILEPEVSLAAAAAELRPDGALTRILSELVPAGVADQHHFIALIVGRLRDALLLPVTRRNEAWVRWLFLIPYGVSSRHAPGASSRSGTPPR